MSDEGQIACLLRDLPALKKSRSPCKSPVRQIQPGPGQGRLTSANPSREKCPITGLSRTEINDVEAEAGIEPAIRFRNREKWRFLGSCDIGKHL